MDLHPKALALDYLKDIQLMQLATSADDKPWLCNVWHVIDSDGNVYWISRDTREHSQHIDSNPYVSCSFQKHYDQGLGNVKGQAVIMSGTAKKLSGEECVAPYALYNQRYSKLEDFQSLEAFTKNKGHHYFYKMMPSTIVWWDEVNFPDEPKQILKGEL